jgi:hypothetical protein
LIVAAAARALFATWPRRARRRSRRLSAPPVAASGIARAIPESRPVSARWAISRRRAIPESRPIPNWRAIPARGTPARGPITGRPVTRRAISAAIEAWGSRRPSRLLPSRRIDWSAIATTSLLRSTRQHPPFAPFGHLSSGQVSIAAERIETTAATAEAAATSRATAATTAWSTTATAAGTARAATSTAAITIAATPIVAARVRMPGLRPRHHVHNVVEIAFLLGIRGRIVTRQDTHQTYPCHALAQHRECLHQT